jgi:hypothetical protein
LAEGQRAASRATTQSESEEFASQMELAGSFAASESEEFAS